MVTDKDGRFRIVGLMPNLKYNLTYLERINKMNRLGHIATGVVVRSGATVDLGDVRSKVKPRGGPAASNEISKANGVSAGNRNLGVLLF